MDASMLRGSLVTKPNVCDDTLLSLKTRDVESYFYCGTPTPTPAQKNQDSEPEPKSQAPTPTSGRHVIY